MMLRKRSNLATSTSFQNAVYESLDSMTVAMESSGAVDRRGRGPRRETVML